MAYFILQFAPVRELILGEENAFLRSQVKDHQRSLAEITLAKANAEKAFEASRTQLKEQVDGVTSARRQAEIDVERIGKERDRYVAQNARLQDHVATIEAELITQRKMASQKEAELSQKAAAFERALDDRDKQLAKALDQQRHTQRQLDSARVAAPNSGSTVTTDRTQIETNLRQQLEAANATIAELRLKISRQPMQGSENSGNAAYMRVSELFEAKFEPVAIDSDASSITTMIDIRNISQSDIYVIGAGPNLFLRSEISKGTLKFSGLSICYHSDPQECSSRLSSQFLEVKPGGNFVLTGQDRFSTTDLKRVRSIQGASANLTTKLGVNLVVRHGDRVSKTSLSAVVPIDLK